MNDLDIFLRFSFAGLAIILTIISFASYRKIRHGKLGLATIGFGLFATEGILLSLGTLSSIVEMQVSIELLVGIALVALIFFYLSILKR